MKRKKLLSFLTIFSLCLGISATSVLAAEDVVSNPKTYTDEQMYPTNGTAVSSYEELAKAITEGKSKIYITNSIEMKDGILLSGSNQALIGVPSKDGELPVLNFENMKGENDIINNKSSDKDVAVRISGAGNEISNLIIEKGHDNGILIKGTGAINNKVTNCILRYNNDSGLQIAGGARGNTIKSVYSYRNCDVFTLGGNADGFAIKLGAGPAKTSNLFTILDGRNFFKDCYSWENSDDAWDSFDKELKDLSEEFQAVGGYWTYRNDYEDCMCWNNGTPKNAMGYTDYINGETLDENLPFIRRFKALSSDDTYSGFVKAYNDGTLCEKSDDPAAYYTNPGKLLEKSAVIKEEKSDGETAYYKKLDEIFGKIPTSKGEFSPSQIALENWGGNPNGFKLGSKFTQPNSLRYMKNCIAFDHEKYGFDKNNSGAKLYAENCISFGNKINYHLDGYTAYKWENIQGSDGLEPDDLPKSGAENINMFVETSDDRGDNYQYHICVAANTIKENAYKNKTTVTRLFNTLFTASN